ncbi:MAG: hydroxysqualene dehydroxylase HpnE, partial [Beijerinckiaceae bacterium]|nr:hydroxysqualene dehydroxylase HpnE [Beijerinckiaceae bacterium]
MSGRERPARPTVHIVGAGLSGLAAAVALSKGPRAIVLHEGARQAGGRCRSYFDATLGMDIDNGNHLLLSGNSGARAFCRQIGTEDQLAGPAEAVFPFFDLDTGARWNVRPNAGPLPWWVFRANRRVPGTKASDYLALARLLTTDKTATIGSRLACSGTLYRRLWQPFLLAALNTDPPESSAALAGAVIRETLAKGGRACRPLIAAKGLGSAFVDPAIRFLEGKGAEVRLGHPLRALAGPDGAVTALEFDDETIALGPDDRVILAVPPPAAAALLPGLSVPVKFRSIVNAHFKMSPPAGLPPILGVIGGTVEWIFAFPDRISITISGADRLLDIPRETLIETLWRDVKAAAGIEAALPPWQIIREKRATFAATPEEDAKRPGPETRYANCFLAGDWTATGL